MLKNEPTQSELLRIFNMLLRSEEKSIEEIHESEKEVVEIINTRLQETASNHLTISMYDRLHNHISIDEEVRSSFSHSS